MQHLRADTSGRAGLYSAYNQHFNHVSLRLRTVGNRCRCTGKLFYRLDVSPTVRRSMFRQFEDFELEAAEKQRAVCLPPTMFDKASVHWRTFHARRLCL